MADDLERYLALRNEHPDWFSNPPGADLEILFDRGEIAAAEEAKRSLLVSEGKPPEWSTVGLVYEDDYILVLRDAVSYHGALTTYFRIVSREGGVAILPVRSSNVVLLEHFRHATRTWHLEIPRGYASPAVASIESAKRELAEELGSVPTEMVPLGSLHVNSGVGPDKVELFFARIESVGAWDQHEAISKQVEVATPDFERKIADDEITDSFTIAAYARARLRGLIP